MHSMKRATSCLLATGTLAATALLTAFQGAAKPAEQLAGIVKTYLEMDRPMGWDGLEKLPGIRWAALPPNMLTNCLPDGGCFTRLGAVTLGGRSITIIATGARTMVLNIYFRNPGPPLGEEAVVAALKSAGLGAELARCPVKPGVGTTNWYRLKSTRFSPGYLSIQGPASNRPSEGFVLSTGEELPPPQPAQVANFSEQCGPGVERKPVSTLLPHQRLAEVVVALLGQVSGPALYDWKTLAALPTGITWDSAGPRPASLADKNDPSPLMQSGNATWAGRKFSVMASGTSTQVRNVYLEEGGLHPRGEHMLGVVYEKGIAVRLVRCGPVYTESTNNWYSLMSQKTRTAMIRQSIRYEGNSVQDSYAIRLDGTLPAKDPRDREPGLSDCR